MMSEDLCLISILTMNKAHCHTPGSLPLPGGSGLPSVLFDAHMTGSGMRRRPDLPASSFELVLTRKQILLSTDYCLIPPGLALHSTGENFLSCFCSFADRASDRILSCSGCAALPCHD